jgi:hypothetical protein
MFPRCLCVRSTRLSPSTAPTIRGIRFISAGDVVLDRVSTGVPCEDLSLRADVPLRLVVVGNIGHRKFLGRWGCRPFLGGNARIALANMWSRAIGVQLFLGALLEIRFTMGVAGRTKALPRHILLRQPHGLEEVFGPSSLGDTGP